MRGHWASSRTGIRSPQRDTVLPIPGNFKGWRGHESPGCEDTGTKTRPLISEPHCQRILGPDTGTHTPPPPRHDTQGHLEAPPRHFPSRGEARRDLTHELAVPERLLGAGSVWDISHVLHIGTCPPPQCQVWASPLTHLGLREVEDVSRVAPLKQL